MEYRLLGIKRNPKTQEIISEIELRFNSYAQAFQEKIKMIKTHSDYEFNIDYNAGVSLDELLSKVEFKLDYKEFH